MALTWANVSAVRFFPHISREMPRCESLPGQGGRRPVARLSAVSRTCGDVCEHDSRALKSVKVHRLRRCFVPWLSCGPRRRGRSVPTGKVYSFICVQTRLRFLPAALALGDAKRAAKPRWHMPASVFHRAPLFVSDQVLLAG